MFGNEAAGVRYKGFSEGMRKLTSDCAHIVIGTQSWESVLHVQRGPRVIPRPEPDPDEFGGASYNVPTTTNPVESRSITHRRQFYSATVAVVGVIVAVRLCA